MTKFIGIDGESLDDSYFLLAIGDKYLYSGDKARRLTTDKMLSFILAHSRGKILVGYAFDFDVVHICRDLGDSLSDLLRGEVVFYRGYKLRYYRDKLFEIRYRGRRVVIYDVIGFFQRSFIQALKQWGIEVPEVIYWGKSERVNFERAPIERIILYNQTECLLLAELMTRFSVSVKQWELRSWHGCGAIAHAMLRRTKALKHVGYVEYYPVEAMSALRSSYFGGRIELCKVGTIRDVYQYDIRSAYPHALSQLPYVPNRLVKTKEYKPGLVGCYRVRWDWLGKNAYIGPLPVRLRTGYIIYPLKGEGWYMSVELDDIVNEVEILDGWVSPKEKFDYPYRIVEEWYHQRQVWKVENNPAEYGIKLGLNSIYGKFASEVGQFYQPLIASYITAFVRSKIRRACCDECLISYATDSVVTTCALPHLDVGTGLGEWSLSKYGRGIFLMAGVYALDDVVCKTRGFRTLDIEAIVRQIDKGERVYIDVQQFVTPLNACSKLRPFTFARITKELKVYSNFRRHYDFLAYEHPHKRLKIGRDFWDSRAWYDISDLDI